MNRNNNQTDFLVIGSGASGGAFSWRLSSKGFRVTCLEQGEFIKPDKYPTTNSNWEVSAQFQWNWDPNLRNNRYDYPLNNSNTPINPLMFNAVGGSTIHWTAHTPRFHPSDFKVKTLDGVADDWPISYSDLEPYYDLNDEMMGCSGISGDPANPERKKRPMPPLPLGEDGELMAKAFDKLGWQRWPSDSYINSQEYKGRQKCNNCGPSGLGCTRSAKSSTDVTYWPEAIKSGANLITKCRVRKILTDENNNATGAEYEKNGKKNIIYAKYVIIACNGVGTPRLLLLSANERYKNGLANSSGLVGKNLMFHPYSFVAGFFEGNGQYYKGALANILMSQQFYETDKKRNFVRGHSLQMVRSTGPITTALGSGIRRISWGENHHDELRERLGNTLGFSVIAEDLPEEINCVTLDEKLKDSSGLAAPKINYTLSKNSEKILNQAIKTTTTLLKTAGAKKVESEFLMQAAGWHLMGTTKMGDDPKISVTNKWGKVHDLNNLYIIDGSLFVTSAAVNPTPTIQALALKIADHLIQTNSQLKK